MKPNTKLLLKCQKVVDSCVTNSQANAADRYLGFARETLGVDWDDEDCWTIFEMEEQLLHRSYSK